MKKVHLQIDKYLTRIKLPEEKSQEEEKPSTNFFDWVEDPRYLYCPYGTNTPCGSRCAHFDIEEKVETDDYRYCYGLVIPMSVKTLRFVTCKGIPIAEVVEQELVEENK